MLEANLTETKWSRTYGEHGSKTMQETLSNMQQLQSARTQ